MGVYIPDTLEVGPEPECPKRDDGTHCDHWYDGEACCACGAPAMTAEERQSQGME